MLGMEMSWLLSAYLKTLRLFAPVTWKSCSHILQTRSVVVQRSSVVCPSKNLQETGMNPRSVNTYQLLFVARVISETRIIPAGSSILSCRD